MELRICCDTPDGAPRTRCRAGEPYGGSPQMRGASGSATRSWKVIHPCSPPEFGQARRDRNAFVLASTASPKILRNLTGKSDHGRQFRAVRRRALSGVRTEPVARIERGDDAGASRRLRRQYDAGHLDHRIDRCVVLVVLSIRTSIGAGMGPMRDGPSGRAAVSLPRRRCAENTCRPAAVVGRSDAATRGCQQFRRILAGQLRRRRCPGDRPGISGRRHVVGQFDPDRGFRAAADRARPCPEGSQGYGFSARRPTRRRGAPAGHGRAAGARRATPACAAHCAPRRRRRRSRG